LILPKYFGLMGVWASFPVIDLCGGLVSVGLLLYLRKKMISDQSGAVIEKN